MKSVADLMTTEVFAVAPDTSLEAASRMLAQRRVSGAPVVSSEGKVVGVVSLADLVDPDRATTTHEGHSMFYRLADGWAEEQGDPTVSRRGCVEDVMTPAVLTIDDSMTALAASRRILEFGVHRLVVTDDDGFLVGLVSVVDLLRGFVESAD